MGNKKTNLSAEELDKNFAAWEVLLLFLATQENPSAVPSPGKLGSSASSTLLQSHETSGHSPLLIASTVCPMLPFTLTSVWVIYCARIYTHIHMNRFHIHYAHLIVSNTAFIIIWFSPEDGKNDAYAACLPSRKVITNELWAISLNYLFKSISYEIFSCQANRLQSDSTGEITFKSYNIEKRVPSIGLMLFLPFLQKHASLHIPAKLHKEALRSQLNFCWQSFRWCLIEMIQ